MYRPNMRAAPCLPVSRSHFAGGGVNEFPAIAGPTAFSGSVDVSDFSDFAGNGSNVFTLVVSATRTLPLDPDSSTSDGSATVTETILAVPEAPTWVMALIGFAIVGVAARSRRLARPSRRAV